MRRYLYFLPFLALVLAFFWLSTLISHGASPTIFSQPLWSEQYPYFIRSAGTQTRSINFIPTQSGRIATSTFMGRLYNCAPCSMTYRQNILDGSEVIATSTDLFTDKSDADGYLNTNWTTSTLLTKGHTYTLKTTWISGGSADLGLRSKGSYSEPYLVILGEPYTNNISFVIPTASTTEDFDYWSLSYGFADGVEIGEGSPNTGQIVIVYNFVGASTSTDSLYVFEWAEATAIIAKTHATFTLGDWSATAYLYNSSSSLVASSTIGFNINLSGGAYAVPTSTSPTATSSCVSGNFFENGLCYLFNALLVPSQSSLNRFTALKADLTNKPPLGYFNRAKDLILGFGTTTATSTIPLQSLEGLKTGFLGDLRTGLQWLLWIVFLFWIFNRLRHLQL